MLQRIQTIFLAIAFALHISLFFLPLITIHGNKTIQAGSQVELKIHQIETISGPEKETKILYLTLIINSLILILLVISIFMYKNRILQNQFCRFLILLDTGLIVAIVFAFDKIKTIFPSLTFPNDYHFPLIFPVIAVLFVFLAARAIMKDEEKVRAADRLR